MLQTTSEMMDTLDSIDGLVDKHILSELRPGYVLRFLEPGDYDKGYMDVLSHLTTVGIVGQNDFLSAFRHFKQHSYQYHMVVIEDLAENKIVGCGTLFMERKFIHGCGVVGHLEDVVTLPEYRGKQFGKIIIRALTSISQNLGAYKTILDCSAKNLSFYREKCGFTLKEYQMVVYHDWTEKSKL